MENSLILEDLDTEVRPGGIDEPVLHAPAVIIAVWVIVQETSPAN